MTLPAATPRGIAIGNGTRGPFTMTDSDGNPVYFGSTGAVSLRRYSSVTDEDGEALVYGADFTLTGIPGTGVTFTLTSLQDVLASTERIVWKRTQNISQTLALSTGGDFSSTAIMARLDQHAQFMQDLRRDVDRKPEMDWRETSQRALPIAPTSGTSLLARNSAGAIIHAELADFGDGTPVNADWMDILSVTPGSGWGDVLAAPYEVSQSFATYAVMTAATVTDGSVYETISYDNILNLNDGSSGRWLYVQASTRPANGGTILAHDSGTGRFFRLHSGGECSPDWFGAKRNGITNDRAAIQAAVDTVLGWNLTTASAKTADFTAASGYLYPCNTTSAAFTATLPASPVQGDIIGFYDSQNTWDSNNLTIGRNGKNIEGAGSNKTLSTEGRYYVLIYDTTAGWTVANNGGVIRLGPGIYSVGSAVNIDLSYLSTDTEIGRLSLRGSGEGSAHILSTHNGKCLNVTGDAGNGLFGYMLLEDMTLRGSGLSGSTGLWMDNVATFSMSRVRINDFDYGIDGTDVLTSGIHNCRIRYNNKNYRFRYSDVSRPNAISFSNTVTAAAYEYGGLFEGASSISYDSSCTLEGNGITAVGGIYASGWGLKFSDSCVEGGVGLQWFGNYVEYNAGIADFVFDQTTGTSTHLIAGASICRISSTLYTTNNIKITKSGGGTIKVTVRDCAFKALSSYSESASRLYVSAPAGTFYGYNNKWGSATAQSTIDKDQAGFYARKRGLLLQNSSGDPTNDIDVTAGGWLDSTFEEVMVLPSLITKRLDASWAVGTGNGGLDTGSIADTTYNVFLIKRHDTGVTDVIFSTSTSPAMPSNYDYYVRIGSIIRSSSAILTFEQVGKRFILKAPGLSFTADNGDLTTARVTKTLAGIPTGIQVDALLTVKFTDLSPASDKYLRIMTLGETDATAASTNGNLQVVTTDGTLDSVTLANMSVRTNTSAQIGARTSLSDTDTYLSAITRGWDELWEAA